MDVSMSDESDKVVKTTSVPDTPNEPGDQPGSTSGCLVSFVFVFVLTAVSVIISLYGKDYPWLVWALPLAIIAPYLLIIIYVYGRVIWQRITWALIGAPRPLKIRQNKEGKMTIKCPDCQNEISLERVSENESAFTCEECGWNKTLQQEEKS